MMESLDRVGGDGYAQFVGDGNSSVDLENSLHQPFTQEDLVAYVDVIQSMTETSRIMDGKQWDLKWLTTLVTILKGAYRYFDFETILLIAQISAVLTYSHSLDYRPNIDTLHPVQVRLCPLFFDRLLIFISRLS